MNAVSTPSAKEAEGTSTPDDTLATLVQWVEDAESEGATMRERSERDRDYYDGLQITEQEAAELRARNQPVIAFNLTKGKVDYLLGLEKQQRSDPKAFPRNPDDEQSAEAATDAIRYVCDLNSFQMIASQTWENMVIEGAGGCDVCAEQKPNGDFEITVKRVHWDRMIWDPYSRERDYSDAKFLGVIVWMDEADILAKWPDAKTVVDFAYDQVSNTEAWSDRPRWSVWADQKRRRIRVVQLYWREGDAWQYGTFTRGGWLDEAAPSYYQDEDGKPECPLVYASAYVNRDNHRYGVVRDLIDPQDEINLRHRKAVHLLSARQTVAEEGAVRDVDAARKELAKPDGYIEVAPGMRFEISQTADLSAGQASLLQEAKAMFQTMGPNAALLGKQGNSASGRAIALSQQGGQMEIGAVMDLHRDWRRRVYKKIWNRVRQFWTAEKWVRVTDDERNVRFVGLNQPMFDPMTGQVTVHNNVAEIVVDIVVEEGPDVATLRQEQFATLAEVAKAAPGAIAPDMLIEASDLRNKEKILKRLRGEEGPNGEPPPPPPPPPELIIAQARMQADQQKAQMDAQMKMAGAQQDAELEREKMAQAAQLEAMRIAAEREAEAMRMEAEDRRHATKLEMDRQIALINAAAGAVSAQQQPAAEPAPEVGPEPDQGMLLNASLVEMMGRLENVAAMMAAPRYREVVRGPDGRAQGVVERIG